MIIGFIGHQKDPEGSRDQIQHHNDQNQTLTQWSAQERLEKEEKGVPIWKQDCYCVLLCIEKHNSEAWVISEMMPDLIELSTLPLIHYR